MGYQLCRWVFKIHIETLKLVFLKIVSYAPNRKREIVFFFQIERFVDRKLDKAEELLKKKETKAKKWYNKFTSDNDYHATESHVFMASFVAGMALGLICGK